MSEPIKEIKEIKADIFKEGNTLNDYIVNDEIQLVVKENRQKSGQPIFILPDGKIGFPSKDSIPVNIGDVVTGKIAMITDRYVFVTASEILHKNEEGV